MDAFWIFFLWTMMVLFTGMGLGAIAVRAKTVGSPATKKLERWQKLQPGIMADDTKRQRAEQLLKYHEQRVSNGADHSVSLERLFKELEELSKE